MIPMSSRRRAAVAFLVECSPFVNQRALYSITSMSKFYIESSPTILLGTRRQANGFVTVSILFYNNRGKAVLASISKFRMAGLQK
jgi:hypothetical protein